MHKDGRIIAILNDDQALVEFLDADFANTLEEATKFVVFEETPLDVEARRSLGTADLAAVQIPKGRLELKLLQENPKYAVLGAFDEIRERTVRRPSPLMQALVPSSFSPQEEIVVARQRQPIELSPEGRLGITVGPAKVGDFVARIQ